VNPARTGTVHRAVALIGPDEHLRAECVNAVHIALTNVGEYAQYMQQDSQRRGNPGKRALARFHKWLRDGQKLTQDPNLSNEMRQIISPAALARWIELVNEERTKTGGKRYPYKAQKKLSAAVEAHHLLEQFNKKITAEKRSTFCKLAALLYGEPRASLQWACRQVIASLVPPSRGRF
jgi:hypothetical protein